MQRQTADLLSLCEPLWRVMSSSSVVVFTHEASSAHLIF